MFVDEVEAAAEIPGADTKARLDGEDLTDGEEEEDRRGDEQR